MFEMFGLIHHNMLFWLCQVEKLDGMARGRLVYIQWMGERSRPMAKAKTTTHRSQIEELFQVYMLTLNKREKHKWGITDKTHQSIKFL